MYAYRSVSVKLEHSPAGKILKFAALSLFCKNFELLVDLPCKCKNFCYFSFQGTRRNNLMLEGIE